MLGLGVRQVIEELVQSEDKIAKKFVRCPVIPNGKINLLINEINMNPPPDSKFAKATQDLIELEAYENVCSPCGRPRYSILSKLFSSRITTA